MNNKKGSAIVIILLFLVLFTILIVGFMLSMGAGVVDYAADELMPVLTGVGAAGGTNFSEDVNYVITPVNTLVQAAPWIVGFGYVVALILSIVFVTGFRVNPSPVFLGFYVMMVVLLIFGAIIMSQMYQDIYTGEDMMGEKLQEQPLMSYMILYSPVILTIIALISGIYLFARPPDELGGGL